MKILVDENIPRMTVDRLRELGHDVRDVRGSGDQGLEDFSLWSSALSDGRVLITGGYNHHGTASEKVWTYKATT